MGAFVLPCAAGYSVDDDMGIALSDPNPPARHPTREDEMRHQDTRTVVDSARDTPADAPDDITRLRTEVARLTRELEEARAENARMREDAARWPDTESLALQVLDEVEAAIAAGRAMGHGAYAIVHRLRRLLVPSLRADSRARAAQEVRDG